MPTPSDDTLALPSPPSDTSDLRALHTTCPPEDGRQIESPAENLDTEGAPDGVVDSARSSPEQQPTPSSDSSVDAVTADINETTSSLAKPTEVEEATIIRDTPSPLSSATESKEVEQREVTGAQASTSSPIPIPYSSLESPWVGLHRFRPNSTSSFLRPGSKFCGSQQSDRQVYDVQVEIKHVDMAESFLCGYLRIQGLTDDHPTLTTYFEGEIIGNKYTFATKHPEWGSSEKVDMQHWGRFAAWRPLAKQAKRPEFSYKNYAQREYLFMRWKEYFLVPDHRVRTITGASFEGFYYICFNQVTGTISGIYFHAKSERYQQLELKHVDDRGCQGAMEFR
ncbi:MAG: hypothetical protein M1820_000521 [Bogoriella megaspora]|nr:MAG: hypothetical protein M1820_000521 [Bogoriella megaspora]